MSENIQRKIRSFVMRTSKMTPGQKRAIEDIFPQFALDEKQKFDVKNAFGNNNRVCVDIGFGNGESLVHIAQMQPDVNFVGMEVHTPGVGHLLLQIEKYGINNIRIYQYDGTEVLKDCFANNTIDAMHIYFPDPWHKKRHHKRRLIQDAFLEMLMPKLKDQARMHIATDWQQYAEHIQDVFSRFPHFINVESNNDFTDRPHWRPITKFERRGINLGHDSYDLIYHLNRS